jgi:hypothetical protein
MIVYKSLNNGKSPFQFWDWTPYFPKNSRPGKWAKQSLPPALCYRGFHGWLTLARAEQEGQQVFEMELAGEIVQDKEKAASNKVRLLKRVFSFEPEGPIKKGIRRCETCGKPHDSYIIRKNLAPQWVDLKDGHPYNEEPWEAWAARVKTISPKVYAEVRHEYRRGYTGPGTYDPVVPAFHGPFKLWTEHKDECGTCGLAKNFHEGWEEREKLSKEFVGLDRWELLIEIQNLRAKNESH